MSDKKYQHIGTPLCRLIEEASEVIHIACKIQRFGYMNHHPEDPNKTTNMELLKRETADFFSVWREIEKEMTKTLDAFNKQ
jgi:hypothetical protein